MEDIFAKIIAQTYTIHDTQHRLRVLKAYIESQLFGSVTPILTEQDKQFVESFEKFKFTKDNISSIFQGLEQKIKQIQPLTIYTPFEVEIQQLTEISQWVRQNINPNLILDFKLDPNLIGGCSLVWKGVYRDYSIKQRIKQQSDLILKEFKSYKQ